jgi:hypothetical protein
MSRNGKIARLSYETREGLNRRLQDGEGGAAVLDWLNDLPEVREIVREQFGGVPVSKQNLSEWRAGGYQEWLRREESLGTVRELMERAEGVNTAANEEDLGDWLSVALSVELVKTTEALLAEKMDARERWKLLREILPHLAMLRREDHRGRRVQMAEERWEREVERLDEQEIKRESETEEGLKRAERLAAMLSRAMTQEQAEAANGQVEEDGQTKSNQVAPNQTKN